MRFHEFLLWVRIPDTYSVFKLYLLLRQVLSKSQCLCVHPSGTESPSSSLRSVSGLSLLSYVLGQTESKILRLVWNLWAGEVYEPRKCHGSSEWLVAEAHQGPVILANQEGLNILDALADDDEGVVQEGGQQQDVPWLQSVAVLGDQVTNHHYKVRIVVQEWPLITGPVALEFSFFYDLIFI